MRKLALILIIIGVAVAASPLIGQLYTLYQQKALLRQLSMQPENANQTTDSLEQTSSANPDDDYLGLQDVFNSDKHGNKGNTGSVEVSPSPGATSIPAKKTSKPKVIQKVIGEIIIKKIKVDVPVVEGVKNENLRVAVGHFPGTALPGAIGNCSIAGHRSYSFGRFFNRLNEIKAGDEIVIKSKSGTYKYIVFKILIVDPKNTSVLKASKTDRMLTLVTCDPIYVATHRLIVKAKMEPDKQPDRGIGKETAKETAKETGNMAGNETVKEPSNMAGKETGNTVSRNTAKESNIVVAE